MTVDSLLSHPMQNSERAINESKANDRLEG